MELKELLITINNEFPEKSIDISESLGLLMDTIDDLMNEIKNKIGQAYLNRNFSNVEKYIELGKAINFYENEIDEVINITRVESTDYIREETDSKIKNLPDYEQYLVDNKIEHTLYENFTHIRPYAFKINNSEVIEVRTWQEMLLKTCENFISIDPEKFLKFEHNKIMNGKKNKYFSVNPQELRKPEKVADMVYIETNMSGNSIRNLIVKILKEYEINISNYKVYFRADYTNINR